MWYSLSVSENSTWYLPIPQDKKVENNIKRTVEYLAGITTIRVTQYEWQISPEKNKCQEILTKLKWIKKINEESHFFILYRKIDISIESWKGN